MLFLTRYFALSDFDTLRTQSDKAFSFGDLSDRAKSRRQDGKTRAAKITVLLCVPDFFAALE